MRRILLVHYDLGNIGGSETVAVNLANGLSDLNKYKIYLLSLNTTVEKIPYDINKNVHFIEWKTLNKRVLYTYFMRRRNFKLLVEREKIDIIIFVGMASLFSVAVYPNEKIKIINCDHSGLLNHKENKKEVITKWIEVRKCDNFIVLNELIRKEYIDYLKADSNKILIIPNWIDNTSIDVSYCSESKKMVTIGRLSEEKGYDLWDIIEKLVI